MTDLSNISSDELINLLKDKLTISIDFQDAGSAPWAGDHELIVKLKLDNITISTSTTWLPNPTRSEY